MRRKLQTQSSCRMKETSHCEVDGGELWHLKEKFPMLHQEQEKPAALLPALPYEARNLLAATSLRSKPAKRVRFLEAPNAESQVVGCSSYCIGAVDAELWWTRDELRDSRQEGSRIAREIRSSQSTYQIALEILASSFRRTVKAEDVSSSMAVLAGLPAVRGLERHFTTAATEHQWTVLDAQRRLNEDKVMDVVRRQLFLKVVASKSSRPPTQLALKLAALDREEAFQAVHAVSPPAQSINIANECQNGASDETTNTCVVPKAA